MSVLSATNLAKSYRGYEVVQDVSLEVSSGEVVGLLGPNGAGKTTCFYMIVGSISHDRGEVAIDGEEITHLPVHERARRGIGYLPQEASVFRKLTVRENLQAILETRSNLTQEEQDQQASTLIEEFRISHIEDNQGISLSGGERRLLEISRALVMEPNILLVDEPSIGLEPRFIDMVFEILDDLQRNEGKTIIMVEQNAKKGLEFCDIGYVLVSGNLALAGSGNELLENPEVGRLFLGG